MSDRIDTATRHIRAATGAIFRAFTDADALMAWLPPSGMSGRALLFEPRQGGRYRIELVYETAEAPGGGGKSGERSDISAGTFLELEPNRRIVQSVAFESDDPAFDGEMVITWAFEPAGPGTQVTVSAEQVPSGISADDHEAGLASSLENLARFVERTFYHGTRADLAVGDLLRPGFTSNFAERKLSWIYFSASLEAAIWGAELARGEGRERIYIVEPTDEFEDDPNLTDKKFPGNPTESYRSRGPLRVVGEVTDWQGHSPEQLEAMKTGLARLEAEGRNHIID